VGEAGGGAQFERPGLLLPRDSQRVLVASLLLVVASVR
jgi:hypothetical protein